MVSVNEVGAGEDLVLVDSACEIHLTDPKVVRRAGGMIGESAEPLKIMAAGGHRLPHHGCVRAGFEVEGGRQGCVCQL